MPLLICPLTIYAIAARTITTTDLDSFPAYLATPLLTTFRPTRWRANALEACKTGCLAQKLRSDILVEQSEVRWWSGIDRCRRFGTRTASHRRGTARTRACTSCGSAGLHRRSLIPRKVCCVCLYQQDSRLMQALSACTCKTQAIIPKVAKWYLERWRRHR